MEPQSLSTADWAQLALVVTLLYLVVALAVVGAIAWLLHSAILPSLQATGDLPALAALRWRRVLLPTGLLSLALMLLALARAVALAITVAQHLFPRFAI